jgi:hypothetical protein
MVSELVEQGKRVILMGQVPPFPAAPAACIGRAWRFKWDEKDCFASAPAVRKRLEFSNALLRQLAAEFKNVYAFIPSDILCNDKVCSPFLGDVFLYHDDDHISAVGSKQFVKYVMQLPPFAEHQVSGAAIPSKAVRNN